MLRGIQLKISMGVDPQPVPGKLLEALVSASVDMASGSSQSGFQLVFEFPRHSPLQTQFLDLSGAQSDELPFIRVALSLVVNGRTEPLINGVMLNVSARPSSSGNVQVTLMGKDLTALMNREERPGRAFPASTPSKRVEQILKDYRALDVISLVVPVKNEEQWLPLDRTPQQQGTDFAYIAALAEQVGYVFFLWAESAPGITRAYFGPEIRMGEPQPALTTGMDALNTVDQLSFSFDHERRETPVVHTQQDARSGTQPVSVQEDSTIKPKLGRVSPGPAMKVYLSGAAHLSTTGANARGQAHAARRGDAVTGSGSLDTAVYGRVLRPGLVGVRGAGAPYDGLHYVTKVSHQFSRGSCKATFELSRDRLGSTVERVQG